MLFPHPCIAIHCDTSARLCQQIPQNLHLSFGKHVSNVCRACYFHIRAFLCDTSARLCQQIPRKPSPALRPVCGLTIATHCSQSCWNPTWTNFNAFKTTSRRFLRREHITLALKELHLLLFRARITFKVAPVVRRLRQRRQPPYLADLISDYDESIAIIDKDSPG